MKIIFPMIMTSMFLFGIDCSKIDIEAKRVEIQNNMNSASYFHNVKNQENLTTEELKKFLNNLNNNERSKQRKEAKEFSKCLLFQDLNRDEHTKSKALLSLSKLSLTSGEKELFSQQLDKNFEKYNGFQEIENEKGKYLFYYLGDDKDDKDNFYILAYLYNNKKITEIYKSIKKDKFKNLICKQDTVTRLLVESEINKKFQCEVPASKEYYGVYNLSKINRYIPVGKIKLQKGTYVKIVTATNRYVTFIIINTEAKSYKMDRKYFDKCFSQTSIKKGK